MLTEHGPSAVHELCLPEALQEGGVTSKAKGVKAKASAAKLSQTSDTSIIVVRATIITACQ